MVKHPAKFSDAILARLPHFLAEAKMVLDPFGGVGRLQEIRPDAVCLDLEREWIAQARGKKLQGNALQLPFASRTFDAICTSPCYGNRMSDHHEAKDRSTRHTYRHSLGHQLHPDNAGALQWGEEYRIFHARAWLECWRVLKPGGVFVLNVSDHIRHGAVMPVSAWHVNFLRSTLGFVHVRDLAVFTPRQRNGENRDLRVSNEWLFLLRKRPLTILF